MSRQVQYVYRVRNKKTGEFLRGYNGRSLWLRKHNAEEVFKHWRRNKDDFEVVTFELVEVIDGIKEVKER